jgi:hypothetical protein
MMVVTIDPGNHPDRHFRIDSFSVPETARAEFEAAMRRSLAFLETLPGFMGHVVFEKTGGQSSFNVVTLAMWESSEAMEAAATQVRVYYQSISFEPQAALLSWGVQAEIGSYVAHRGAGRASREGADAT